MTEVVDGIERTFEKPPACVAGARSLEERRRAAGTPLWYATDDSEASETMRQLHRWHEFAVTRGEQSDVSSQVSRLTRYPLEVVARAVKDMVLLRHDGYAFEKPFALLWEAVKGLRKDGEPWGHVERSAENWDRVLEAVAPHEEARPDAGERAGDLPGALAALATGLQRVPEPPRAREPYRVRAALDEWSRKNGGA